jgi:O-antigen/teichoic acid export membrane protein
MEEKTAVSAKSLLSGIFKYSIATWINFIVYGLSLLFSAFFLKREVYGPVDIFMSTVTLFMNICILGLDQAFIRFFNEPPEPLDKDGLFSACFGIASITLLAAAIICGVFFPSTVLGLFFSDPLGNIYLWLLFLNAFISMFGRFINILYRMDGNIKLYTISSVAMRFCLRVFYFAAVPFGANFKNIVFFETLGLIIFAIIFGALNFKRLNFSREILTTQANRQILPYGLALAPTAVMLYLNGLFSKVYVSKTIGKGPSGILSMDILLSNIVAMIQAGFATFWSAFIYSHYKTEQEKIKSVHDYLTFIMMEFLCLILAFEDVIFLIMGSEYSPGKAVFPILLIPPVLSVIRETTVYGISIAKKPIFDTVGIALSVLTNIVLCVVLAPKFNLYGVCIALAAANIIMFTFRTVIAQKLYDSIPNKARTLTAVLLMFLITALCCVFTSRFFIKFFICIMGMCAFLFLYKNQLAGAVEFCKSILKDFKSKKNS